MNPEKSNIVHPQIYYRLIALWVLCEALAGGMFHAIKVPGSGLIVGGCAVICICLMAHYYPKRGAILKATLIVAIFKMMLSPHTPATAYLAVFFQGFCGEILFGFRSYYKISCVLLGFLALVESSIQRIIVLTIIYGTAFWKAVNEFIKKLTGEPGRNNYSLYLAIGYVLMHAVAGIAIGIYASNIPRKLSQWKVANPHYLIVADQDSSDPFIADKKKKKKKFKTWLVICWLIVVVFYLQSIIFPSSAWMPSSVLLGILIRSVIIVLTWYLFLGPLFLFFIKKWLSKKQNQNQKEIGSVLALLPATRNIFRKSWIMTNKLRGLKRIRQWGKIVLVNVLE